MSVLLDGDQSIIDSKVSVLDKKESVEDLSLFIQAPLMVFLFSVFKSTID